MLFVLFLNSSAVITEGYRVYTQLPNWAHILFLGPCIFNNEDKKINQQNAQINSGLIY